MRQFVLAKGTYATSTDITLLAKGQLGVYYFKDGKLALSANGKEFKGEASIIVGRPANEGGPISFPLYTNNFSYVKGVYSAATKFAATITIPKPSKVGDYSVIVAAKGKKFNERNKWTSEVHITNTSTTANTLASKLAAGINAMSETSGVSASVSDAVITITGINAGDDFAIIPADLLTNTKVTVSTTGFPAYGDAKYIQDLAEKAAADAGFEYTYRDAYYYLYPDYPLDPLKADASTDTGFTIFTLRFSEHRKVKTVDQAINQIVQIAFPMGAAAITTLESICKGLSGEVVDEVSTQSLDD